MARIAQTDIERLKEVVSVARLIEAAGIVLNKAGKDLAGYCPFHADETASLIVTPAKNLWHCFGCQIGGGPIDWVMQKNGVSFRHAVEVLKADPSLVAALAPNGGGSAPTKRSSARVLPAPVLFDADDQALLNQTIGYYHETLKQSPEALAYLGARGLNHPDVITHFKLGYANRTLGLRLPDKDRKDGALIRARLQKVGLLRDSGHEHFNGSLVVPVLDEAGNVVEVYGRKLLDNLRVGTPKHLYLPADKRASLATPGRGVFNVAALKTSQEIILCEAILDALTFWCAGFRNVTTAYGVEGFTPDMLAAFKQYGTERVLIAYDRDEAGDRAAHKLAAQLMALGIACYRVVFAQGLDANATALQAPQSAQARLGNAIRHAQWMGEVHDGAEKEVDSVATDEAENAAEKVTNRTAALPTATVPPSPPPLPASPLPPLPALEAPSEIQDNAIRIVFGERHYRVRGLDKNTSPELLKVNVLVACGEHFHVDTLDLYAARARTTYIAQAALMVKQSEEVIRGDLGRVLLKLETLQDERLRKSLEPAPVAGVAISEADRRAALALLTAPDLIGRIVADMAASGITGETTNKLVGYLAATSRKLAHPLAIVIRSSSAAGKTSLMDAVLAMMPAEEKIKYSAMTGQSLFYMGQANLKHKILALAEEEGASRAAYALKLLQSEGELTMASTGKDAATGNLITQEYRVEGPVMLFTTTTALDIDPELLNRCLVLTVDEGREQTQAIHRLQRQRRTLQGLLAKEQKDHILTLHQNAQRLLRPLAVMNPYADRLTFPDNATRTRRDHEKYLTLIDTIALLHQYQRPIKTAKPRTHSAENESEQSIEYIEVTREDIACANALAHEVLGRSLDELPPQTRTLLGSLCPMVQAMANTQGITRSAVRFTRRQAREALALGDTQLRLHLERLVELEYVIARRDGPGGKFVYELAYDIRIHSGASEGTQTSTQTSTQTNRPHLPGLIDVGELDSEPLSDLFVIDPRSDEVCTCPATIPNSRGQADQVAGVLRPACGSDAGPLRGGPSPAKADGAGDSSEMPEAFNDLHCSSEESTQTSTVASYPASSLAASSASSSSTASV